MTRWWRRRVLALALTVPVAAVGLATASGAQAATRTVLPPRVASLDRAPMVVGHRGAAGYRPEHTLEGYRLAVGMGADAIEPDLASTRDGVLVDVHDFELSATTDIARHPELAPLRRTRDVGGVQQTGWFVDDLTLAQLETLRVVERMPAVRPVSATYSGRWQIPTFDQVLTLRAQLSQQYGRAVVVYPESKNPTIFRGDGVPLEEGIADALRRFGLDSPTAPVLVQSFEPTSLQRLRTDLGLRVRLVQLLAGGRPYDFAATGDPHTFASLMTPSGLAWVASYAWAVAPADTQVLPRRSDGRLAAPTTLVQLAHAAGLRVHVYTLRSENMFLPVDYRVGTAGAAQGRAAAYDGALLRAGVDGLFCDQPDVCVAARRQDAALQKRSWSPGR